MTAVNPAPFLKSLVGKKVIVKSKWGPQYVATLISCDAFMNLHLGGCVEHCGGADDEEELAEMQDVLIRCNNVMYVREVPEGSDAQLVPM
jgi:small nuclear ribonucleoprotein F